MQTHPGIPERTEPQNALPDEDPPPTFWQGLRSLINYHSAELPSNVPDYVLASYLVDCLHAFERASGRARRVMGEAEWATEASRTATPAELAGNAELQLKDVIRVSAHMEGLTELEDHRSLIQWVAAKPGRYAEVVTTVNACQEPQILRIPTIVLGDREDRTFPTRYFSAKDWGQTIRDAATWACQSLERGA